MRTSHLHPHINVVYLLSHTCTALQFVFFIKFALPLSNACTAPRFVFFNEVRIIHLVFRITSFTDLCWFLKYLTVISDAYVSSCVCTGVFAISLGGGNVFFKWDSLAVRSQLIRRLIQFFFGFLQIV